MGLWSFIVSDHLLLIVVQELADVIVMEIFDSILLGEGVLPTMRHALEALAKVWISFIITATSNTLLNWHK